MAVVFAGLAAFLGSHATGPAIASQFATTEKSVLAELNQPQATDQSLQSQADDPPSKDARDLIRRLREITSKKRSEIQQNGVTSQNQALILQWIDDAQREIDTLLDPNLNPSLTPVDAGVVLLTVPPTTALEHAILADDLAAEAEAEADDVDPSHELIGSYVKTIDFWLMDFFGLVNN